MKRSRTHSVILALTLALGVSQLFGCGGSDGTSTAVQSGTGSSGMISGTATKGPVSGGTVMAYAVNDGTMGALLGSGVTDDKGNFSIPVGKYSGPVMLQMIGGTYTDEATGGTTTMLPGDVMTAVIPSTGDMVTGVQMTPVTSMAQALAHNMNGGMTPENIAAANTAMGNLFMVSDILHTQPMNPLVPGAGAKATQNERNYGMTMAAMSQYARQNGMPSSSDMVTAMMNDASDGFMNGMMGSSPVMMDGGMMGSSMMPSNAATTGLADAMATFMTSTMNQSGLTVDDMRDMMDHMSAYNGQMPGNTGTAGGTMMGDGEMMGGSSQGGQDGMTTGGSMMGEGTSSSGTTTGGTMMGGGAYSGGTTTSGAPAGMVSGTTFHGPA